MSERVLWYRLGTPLYAREEQRRNRRNAKRLASLRASGERLNSWGQGTGLAMARAMAKDHGWTDEQIARYEAQAQAYGHVPPLKSPGSA